MPYVKRICSKCGRRQEVYHNVWKCRRCKASKCLISEGRHEHQTRATLKCENAILRAEVNVLRVRLGLGVKYREWEDGPAT